MRRQVFFFGLVFVGLLLGGEALGQGQTFDDLIESSTNRDKAFMTSVYGQNLYKKYFSECSGEIGYYNQETHENDLDEFALRACLKKLFEFRKKSSKALFCSEHIQSPSPYDFKKKGFELQTRSYLVDPWHNQNYRPTVHDTGHESFIFGPTPEKSVFVRMDEESARRLRGSKNRSFYIQYIYSIPVTDPDQTKPYDAETEEFISKLGLPPRMEKEYRRILTGYQASNIKTLKTQVKAFRVLAELDGVYREVYRWPETLAPSTTPFHCPYNAKQMKTWVGVGPREIPKVDEDSGEFSDLNVHFPERSKYMAEQRGRRNTGGGGRGVNAKLGKKGTKKVKPKVRRGIGRMGEHCNKEDVRKVVGRGTGRIRYCYEKGCQYVPTLEGKIAVSWIVDRSGNVINPKIAKSTLGNRAVDSCILRAVKAWKFSPVDEKCQIIYPFTFEGVQ